MTLWKTLGLVGTLGLAIGCGSTTDEDSLGDADTARVWATTASALAAYFNVYEPVAVADGERSYEDPTCPVVMDDGTTFTIEGGCVDRGGKEWVGSVRLVRSANGDRSLSLEQFGGIDDPDMALRTSGTAEIRRIAEDHREFTLDLAAAGGVVTNINYSGSVRGGYVGPTVWNGAGTVTRRGFPPEGTVQANTVDQLVDDAVCSGQPSSGQTTLADGEHVVVVTYDGAMDCDDDAAARWSVDGRDRGLLTGISCSTSRAGGGGGPSVGLLALLALAGVGRRRSALLRLGGRFRRAAREHG